MIISIIILAFSVNLKREVKTKGVHQKEGKYEGAKISIESVYG